MRLDTWVFWASIALPALAIGVLLLWHLAALLGGKLTRKRTTFRHSPEPPRSIQFPKEHTPAAAEDLPGGRIRRARELLALAEDDFRTLRFLGCLNRCKELGASFPDLPESAKAKQLADQITNDPQRLQQACAALVDSLAQMYVELAECWLRHGQAERAAACFQKVVQICPEARQTQAAQDGIRQIRNEIRPAT
jgi:hypothetical protein